MTTFDSTKDSLSDLLREIREGKIQEKQVGLADDEMDDLLVSHAFSPALLRSDDFARFIEDRHRRLLAFIERAMGKQVGLSEEKKYEIE